LSARRKARELVLKALYAYQTAELDPSEARDTLFSESELSEKTIVFATSLFDVVVKNLEKADQEINAHSENWHISRLADMDKNIMRIALCEFFFIPDIPSRVSINEAIELAKKYSTPDSSSFVNGILNAVLKEHAAEIEG